MKRLVHPETGMMWEVDNPIHLARLINEAGYKVVEKGDESETVQPSKKSTKKPPAK